MVVGGQGRAYVLNWTGNTFTPVSTHVAPQPTEQAGLRVDIAPVSSSLSHATFGAPGLDTPLTANLGGFGAFKEQSTGWAFDGYHVLSASGPSFTQADSWAGADVAMAPQRRAIGAFKHDRVVIQAYLSGSWQTKSVLHIPSPDSSGVRVDFSPSGKYLAITQGPAVASLSALSSALPNDANHTVFIYEDTSQDASTWTLRHTVAPPSGALSFGYAIAMGEEDLFVSDPGEGDLYRYTRSGTTWTYDGVFSKYGSTFGMSIDFDGTYLVASKIDNNDTAIFIMKYR